MHPDIVLRGALRYLAVALGILTLFLTLVGASGVSVGQTILGRSLFAGLVA
jgi:hypothetical protein